jgi:hypothetical protein
VDEDSVLLFLGNGKPLAGRIVDLSQEGCRMRTEERVTARAGSPVEVFFRVNSVAFRFGGVLQWNDGGHLLGIRFVNMNPQRVVELANVICAMQEDAAVRADAVSLLVAEPAAPKPVGRDANEWAEDRSRESADSVGRELPEAEQTAAPALSAESGPESSQASTYRNRRRQARQEMDTSATIFLVRIGSTLRGRILDLSLNGCRIRTDVRFPVGIYTRVETEFCLEGLRFRLGGVIQAIHNRNTVGIRFLDLSDRKRQQVLELIGEIKQLHAAQTTAEPAAEGCI